MRDIINCLIFFEWTNLVFAYINPRPTLIIIIIMIYSFANQFTAYRRGSWGRRFRCGKVTVRPRRDPGHLTCEFEYGHGGRKKRANGRPVGFIRNNIGGVPSPHPHPPPPVFTAKSHLGDRIGTRLNRARSPRRDVYWHGVAAQYPSPLSDNV